MKPRAFPEGARCYLYGAEKPPIFFDRGGQLLAYTRQYSAAGVPWLYEVRAPKSPPGYCRTFAAALCCNVDDIAPRCWVYPYWVPRCCLVIRRSWTDECRWL